MPQGVCCRGKSTGKQRIILGHTILLVLVSLLPVYYGPAGSISLAPCREAFISGQSAVVSQSHENVRPFFASMVQQALLLR
jgi:hypothetical protein